MLAIEVRFRQGRYHATPWGRHVNEGQVEWPPSPWRLLRALCASWMLQGEPAGFDRLVSRLAESLPCFHLPPSTVAHLRRYLPVGEELKLGLDTFVAIDGPMVFLWPELRLEETELLDRLLEGLPYFGRSESLARVRRVEGEFSVQARPLAQGEECDEVAAVFCPLPSVTVEQLMLGTGQMRKERRNRPPGSRWAIYRWLTESATTVKPVRARLLVYRLGGKVPRWEETLTLAHEVRRAVLGLGDVSPTLLGKVEGETRVDGHRHLHVLPDGCASRSRPSRLLLWAAEGFAPTDLAVLSTLRRVGGTELKPADSLLGASGEGRVWSSLTPFLCSRHPRRGKDSVEDQVRRECLQRGLPEPQVERVEEGAEIPGEERAGEAPPGPMSWLRLTFASEISGPLCLGASCHFGMGRFVPEPG